jgi:hypothetical protein
VPIDKKIGSSVSFPVWKPLPGLSQSDYHDGETMAITVRFYDPDNLLEASNNGVVNANEVANDNGLELYLYSLGLIEEVTILKELAKKQELTSLQIIRQSIRHYQSTIGLKGKT